MITSVAMTAVISMAICIVTSIKAKPGTVAHRIGDGFGVFAGAMFVLASILILDH